MITPSDFASLLQRIRIKLPIQNPLHSFVHNNILQMFESLEFHEALSQAGELYRARTYWPLEQYLSYFHSKKITEVDIMEALDHYTGLGYQIDILPLLGITEKDFFYHLMFAELTFLSEEDRQELEEERLWARCREKVNNETLILSDSPRYLRGKDYWERNYKFLFSQSVHPFIIRLIGSFLDQGQSFWSNPFTQEGFFAFVAYDLKQTKTFLTGWQKVLVEKILSYQGMGAEAIIMAELERMQIKEEEWESYLLELLFDLKGWSGMVNKLETEPWQATVKAPKIRLIEYLAVLLLVESSVDGYLAKENSLDPELIRGRVEEISLSGFQLSLALYQVTTAMKLDSRWVQKLSVSDALKVIDGVVSAERTHRIRLWHEAFEHHFFREALSAFMNHRIPSPVKRPKAQLFFCIDDREESIRRHVEEVDPTLETYGVVGYFGVDMKFVSHKHDRPIAQCPPVISPSKFVKEIPVDAQKGNFFTRINNFFGISDLAFYYQSRTLFRGVLATLVLGTLSVVPMILQVFFPELAKSIKGRLFNVSGAELKTVIEIEKSDETHGYSVKEMACIVKSVFDMCGIREEIAPLVILVGHGSSSTNNPFKQSYGCGACGGNSGLPNSRAFAKMANDPRVRTELRTLGLTIPESTWVVSGFHDTCRDEVTFYDLEFLPNEHEAEFKRISSSLGEACRRNALERCQRFSHPIAREDREVALQHVRERSIDPAQPRPEYGHCRNALAIVGPREFTRNLFLNRRAFLMSYDWRIDPDGKILSQVIIGGTPVCVNINMDYYFSYVDNENFGCGSKLPLNLTALLGVMTGSQGDLRIGLARQMVEIHEPMRNLTVIEAPLSRVKNVFESHPRLRNMLRNHWFRLAVFDPENTKWFFYGNSDFKEVTVSTGEMTKVRESLEAFEHISTTDFVEIEA